MVRIKNIKETTAKLYKDDVLIGKITSLLQLNDVRIQIKEEKVSNYTILWKKKTLKTSKKLCV